MVDIPPEAPAQSRLFNHLDFTSEKQVRYTARIGTCKYTRKGVFCVRAYGAPLFPFLGGKGRIRRRCARGG
jgi:hypothetical protein